MSESNATTICPSEVTLQASAAKKAALRFSPDCDATVIDLTTTDDGDVCLNAQNLGIVHYIHDPEFPASAMYGSLSFFSLCVFVSSTTVGVKTENKQLTCFLASTGQELLREPPAVCSSLDS